jgi:hypothetical protein
MKKVFLAVALTTLLLCNANAQNSDVEIAMQETKVEMFLKKCNFVKTDLVATFYSKGIEINAKVFTDIESGEKIGALDFWEKEAGLLGYLDIDQVSDLITALEHTMQVSNNSSKKDYFLIDYTAPGGINFTYGNHAAGISGTKPGLSLRKKWYSVNEYGIQSVSYSTTGYIGIKRVAQLISTIKEAQITIEKDLIMKTAEPKVLTVNTKLKETVEVVEQPSAEDIQKIEQVHHQLGRLISTYSSQGNYVGNVFNVYNKFYKSIRLTKENVKDIMKVQAVVLTYYNNHTNIYPELEKELKHITDIETIKKVFLSYYQGA